jgi:hypothetical protein
VLPENSGNYNTAFGARALASSGSGSSNIAIGYQAGASFTSSESGNIDIGSTGFAGESDVIRIGSGQAKTIIAGIYSSTVSDIPVYIDVGGQLGTVTSSQRFKRDIQDMGSSSEAILALRPVSFRYKPELDPKGTIHYGLVAEEVEKVAPDLVVRDAQNQVYSVRYDAVNAMLLNEFRKQHEKVEDQARTIAKQTTRSEGQEREIAALKARLDHLAAIDARVEALEKLQAGR